MANMGISIITAKNIVKMLIDAGVMYEATLPNRLSGMRRYMVVDMARCNPGEWSEYLSKAEERAKEQGRTLPDDHNIYPVILRDNDTLIWQYRYTPFTSLAYYISDALEDVELKYHEVLEMSDWTLDLTLKNGKELTA